LLRREGIYHLQLQACGEQLAVSDSSGRRAQRSGPAPKHDTKEPELQTLNKKVMRPECELLNMNGLVELEGVQAICSVGSCAAVHPRTFSSLTVHQDRGAPMTPHNFIDLLAESKTDASQSRPRFGNDIALSEAHCKTLQDAGGLSSALCRFAPGPLVRRLLPLVQV
jgi:hypothetical protein